MLLALLFAGGVAAGCGEPSGQRREEERVAEEALRCALAGDGRSFLRLVAPSFVEQAGEEMPDADEETLGEVLLAGFSADIPLREMLNPVFQVQVEGEKAVVHVWGEFVDAEGERVNLSEGKALRIPLLREGGRWYLDLLDL